MKFKIVILLVIILLTFSCKTEKKDRDDKLDPEVERNDLAKERIYYKDGKLEVITEAMDFQTADTIKSGWNTIVYKNQSSETHFVLMDLYPEGKSIKNAEKEILPPFEKGMRYINKRKIDSAMTAFGKLPAWFQKVKFIGGTGLISPGHTAVSTFKLTPGTYIMECYVKMADGEFHTLHGMIKEVTVVDEATKNNPPTSNNRINISSTKGIQMNVEISPGNNVFEVKYEDQKVYEHFLGHDVNLVKYEDGANLDLLVSWMNWATPTGLQTPSPDGFKFLGGTNNMLAGETGYFEVDLKPGNYVLISEVPEANKKGLFKKFTVK